MRKRVAAAAAGLGGHYIAHYESLHIRDIMGQHRRARLSSQPHPLNIRFQAFGRDYHLKLKSDPSKYFHPNFHALVLMSGETYEKMFFVCSNQAEQEPKTSRAP